MLCEKSWEAQRGGKWQIFSAHSKTPFQASMICEHHQLGEAMFMISICKSIRALNFACIIHMRIGLDWQHRQIEAASLRAMVDLNANP